MRDQVAELIRAAAERVVREIDASQVGALEAIQLTPAKSPEHGDFATNAALVLAKPLGARPRDLAVKLEAAIEDSAGIIAKTEIAGPGFLNLFLASARWNALLVRILEEGERYGRASRSSGERVMVEFVSANPTGPLTIGHGRNAILGDVIARLLEAAGHTVVREYYFNDGGRQMRVLSESLRARYLQAVGRGGEMPEEGYEGGYLVAIANALKHEVGDGWVDASEAQFKARAQDEIFAQINATLERLGIRFDVHFNEESLYSEGLVDAALEDLRQTGYVYEADGATWLRTTDLGLERDRVLVRSSGEPTYLMPDIAYHREKFSRVDRIIDVLGPDHIAQFPSLCAGVALLGLDAKKIELVMYQWVNLRRDGELVKMSTRKATFVTCDEILDDVGTDVFRYFMIERRADTHLDFDVDLARERSERNPVYRIQYAHARLCSIARKADEAGIVLPADPDAFPFERLESPVEAELTKRLSQYPDVLHHAGVAREPQEVARYLLELAGAFHTYISDSQRHRVLSDDAELTLARLGLVRAIRTTLANGLGILGISAPESM